jgi:hypothetical protein
MQAKRMGSHVMAGRMESNFAEALIENVHKQVSQCLTVDSLEPKLTAHISPGRKDAVPWG